MNEQLIAHGLIRRLTADKSGTTKKLIFDCLCCAWGDT